MRPALTLSTRRAKSSTCLLNQCEIERSRSFLTCATRASLTERPQLWLLITRPYSTKPPKTQSAKPPKTQSSKSSKYQSPKSRRYHLAKTPPSNLRTFHPRIMNKNINLEGLFEFLPNSSLAPKEIFKSLRTALYNTAQHDAKKAWLIYNGMIQHSVDKYLTTNHYGFLLSILKYGNSMSPMMTVLENMKSHPSQESSLSNYHISQVLYAMSRHGLVLEACDIIRFTTINSNRLQDKTLLPTANHFHSLAVALKNSNSKSATTIELVTKLMLEGMLQRETILFNTTSSVMLALLSTHQQLKLQFLQAMDQINSKNVNVPKSHPYNVYIYTSLISGFARQGDSESAKRLFDEMKKHKIPPNQVTYGALMEAYSKAGDFGSAIRFITDHHRRGREISSHMITSLLIHAIQRNNLIVAENTVKFITNKKIKVADMDIRLRTALIWLQTKQNVDVARKKFDELYAKDKALVNSIMANHLIMGYGLKRDKENVIATYDIGSKLAKTHEQEQRSKHYLTNSLFHCRDVPAALSVFASMRDQAIPDDITLAMVVQGLILNGERNLAWRLFKTLQTDGIEPNLHAYTSILKLLGHRDSDLKKKNGNPELSLDIISAAGIRLPQLNYLSSSVPSTTEALGLFRRMTGFQKPNVYTYTTLISCFAKHDISRAISIFDHMCAKGVNPTVETYTALIQGCSIFRNSHLALQTFNHMRERRIEPNSVTWRYLLKSLSRSHVDKSQIDKIAAMARKSLDKKLD
ncbi:hypothetical protein MFLAVUS_007782 [Mucor flavus]|uniref:Pentacotripeptide-repeat region of PRORP domain-containing protein n=1 Tax=Mucor flavus TaxID=439312 RepID=A0ABP9Z591_9FUNG